MLGQEARVSSLFRDQCLLLQQLQSLKLPKPLLDHSNETPPARRLRKQQEKATRKGQRVRWGQVHRNMAFSALNSQLPEYLGSGADERSALIVDNRDRRLQSPCQGWLPDEILTNAPIRLLKNILGHCVMCSPKQFCLCGHLLLSSSVCHMALQPLSANDRLVSFCDTVTIAKLLRR